ncbi:hypothetical protein ACWC3X_36440 [Streptomyces populi]
MVSGYPPTLSEVEVEVDGLLQFNALGGDLPGAGFKGLRCVEAVAKGTESGYTAVFR